MPLPNPSREFLERCSAETGYLPVSLEKVVRLGEAAGNIAKHPFLGEALVLKGGTALNLCFGPPKRLSVDLDYNYIRRLDRSDMLADRPRLENALEALTRAMGFRIQKSAEAFAGRKYFLGYRSTFGHEERIEVDLNFLFRLPIAGAAHGVLWQPGGLDRPKVRIVSKAEILIGKILALLDRGALRDIWDLANLPPNLKPVLRDPMFRPCLLALSAILDHPIHMYAKARLTSLAKAQNIGDQLAPMLIQRIDVEVEKIIDQSWQTVSEFITLKQNEKAYLDWIDKGELRLELLFPKNEEEAGRLAEHPVLAWKMENVRKRQTRAISKQ
jgi:predicted nucleotidyltransferase component of viral defense system